MHPALGIELALEPGADQAAEPGQGKIAQAEVGLQLPPAPATSRLKGDRQGGAGLEMLRLQAPQLQLAAIEAQGGLPAAQHRIEPLQGRVHLQAGLAQRSSRQDAPLQGTIPQPIRQLAAAGQIEWIEPPAAGQIELATDDTAGQQPGSSTPGLHLSLLQAAGAPAALQGGLDGFGAGILAGWRLGQQAQGEGAISVNATGNLSPPGPEAPAAGGQGEPLGQAAERQPIRPKGLAQSALLPAHGRECHLPLAAGHPLFKTEGQQAIGMAAQLALQGHKAAQGGDRQLLGADLQVPAVLLPLPRPHQLGRTWQARHLHPGPAIKLAQVGPQAHLTHRSQFERRPPLSQPPEPHLAGLQQAEAQVQTRRLAAGGDRAEHPPLAPGIGTQIGAGATEAQIEHQAAPPPAGQRIQPHMRPADFGRGAVLRPGQKAAGAHTEAIGAETAVRAQLQRPAHDRAHLPLQVGPPALVEAGQDPIRDQPENHSPRDQHAAACQGCRPDRRTPGSQGAGQGLLLGQKA